MEGGRYSPCPGAYPEQVPAPSSFVYSVGLRTRFRGLTTRDGVLLRGDAGWAEFSPFWDYGAAEARTWWCAARESADSPWPAPVRSQIPVNVTVPAVGPERAAQIVADGGGCRTAKVKVAEPGQSVADEQARLEAVRGALGPGGHIRIDANGAWDTDTALSRLVLLDKAAGGLEYVEQPCATVAELAEVRRATHVPVAADESIRRATDPFEVARAQAADLMVLKVQPLGGVGAALRIAQEVGLPAVVSSALETSVGIAAGLALAAALPELPYACGLGTVGLFADDVASPPLLPDGGYLPVGRVEPDPAALGRCEADATTSARWRDRMATMTPGSRT